MTMDELVTCVIPTRNRALLLSRALESVARQSYPNLALIVVDDASTDGTVDVVQGFAERLGEEKVRYIRNSRPRGAAGSRNIGIRAADGPYVAFLDDDDEWLPDKVEAQMSHVSEYPLVGTRIRIIRSGPTGGGRVRALKRWFQREVESAFTILSADDLLVSNCGISPSSMVASTDKVRGLGGFDETLSANQGRDFLLRFALEFGPVLRVNRRLVRQHQDHDFGRISERGGRRFEAMETVHERYADLMPTWLHRFDRARICLQKARHASGEERRRLERQALFSFHAGHSFWFLRLYAAYLRDRIR